MNILVTGGAGFIGSNYVRYCLEQPDLQEIVVLDALTYAGNRESLPLENSRLSFIHGDIRDQPLTTRLLRDHSIGTLVHFAAESHVDRSIHGPETFFDTNGTGTLRLLETFRAYWEETDRSEKLRFHHVSTDEVYGSLSPHEPPFLETTPYAPNSPYAASKAASDHLVRAWYHTYGLPVTTSNCSNNYGPYHFPEKLIPLILVNILHGRPLPIYGDGLQVRDWLYVQDHCRGIHLAIKKGKLGEVYNIGGNNEKTNIEIVKTLCALVTRAFHLDPQLAERFPECPVSQGENPEKLISHVKDRLGHDRRYAINATKAKKELGYVPEETLESGLQKTVNWYLTHELWWRRVMDGSYSEWIEKNYPDKK